MAVVQDISRCVGLLGIRAEMLAMRVALLRHLGRQIQLPSQAQPKPPSPLAMLEPQQMDALQDWLAAGMSPAPRFQPRAVSADAKEVFCSDNTYQSIRRGWRGSRLMDQGWEMHRCCRCLAMSTNGEKPSEEIKRQAALLRMSHSHSGWLSPNLTTGAFWAPLS